MLVALLFKQALTHAIWSSRFRLPNRELIIEYSLHRKELELLTKDFIQSIQSGLKINFAFYSTVQYIWSLILLAEISFSEIAPTIIRKQAKKVHVTKVFIQLIVHYLFCIFCALNIEDIMFIVFDNLKDTNYTTSE